MREGDVDGGAPRPLALWETPTVNEQATDSATRSGWRHARGGLAAATAGGLLIAQAGGSDRELFLSFGFILSAVGLLHIIIGGVAIGIATSRG